MRTRRGGRENQPLLGRNGGSSSAGVVAGIVIACLIGIGALVGVVVVGVRQVQNPRVFDDVKITGVLDKSMAEGEIPRILHRFTILTGSFYPPWNVNPIPGGGNSYPFNNGTAGGWSTELFNRIAKAAGVVFDQVVGDYDLVFGPGPNLIPGAELVEDFAGPNQKPATVYHHGTDKFVQVDGWDTWYNTTARKDAGFTFTDTYSTGPLVAMITLSNATTSDLDAFWDPSNVIGYYQMVTGSPSCPGLTSEMMARYPPPVSPALDNANWKSYTNAELAVAMQDLRDGVIHAFLWTSDNMLPENPAIPMVGPVGERKFVAQLGDATPDLFGFSCIEPGVGQALISYPLPESTTRIEAFQCYFNLGLQRMRASGELFNFASYGILWAQGGAGDPKAIVTPNTPPTFNCSQYDNIVF